MKKMVDLTQLTDAGGCGCKISPKILSTIIKNLGHGKSFPNLLIGNKNSDDAAIYKLNKKHNLVATVDFFSPIVEGAFDYGRISSANALSDVYAMGGTPIIALAILGIPEELSVDDASKILLGAQSICNAHNVALVGGHTIINPQPIFGLAVNGLISNNNIKSNTGAQVGDLIYLTKPIGLGILSTAIKFKTIEERVKRKTIEIMCEVNSIGEKIGKLGYVTTMTDITGFGLLGHVVEVAQGSNVSIELFFDKIPQIEGLGEHIGKIETSGGMRNWANYKNLVNILRDDQRIVLSDPQTSGGLLVFVHPKSKKTFEQFLVKNNLSSCTDPIGVVCENIDNSQIIQVK